MMIVRTMSFTLAANFLPLGAVANFGVPHLRDLPALNPAIAGHKASFKH
jgi:hypothetical protein